MGMNRQTVSRLALFLTGLEQRMADKSAYFIKITAVYKSGTKEFTANILPAAERLKMSFNGRSEIIDISSLSQSLTSHAEAYDSVMVYYEERGQTLVIEADNKNVKMKTGEAQGDEGDKNHMDASHIGSRDYIIKVGHADRLLKEIGILGSNGKVKNDMIRKYNQIDHFVELISDMLKDLCRKHESVTVLDCGCGKSYLTFVLNYYIKEVLKKNCH